MYEFRTTTGAICCSGTDIRHLCDSCKARAKTVEAPASLVAALSSGKRPADRSQHLAAHFNKPRPLTTTSTRPDTGSVSAPPSLITAIQGGAR